MARAQIAHTQPLARIAPPIGHCVLILAQANPVLNGSPNTLTRDLHPTSVLQQMKTDWNPTMNLETNFVD